MFSGFTPGATVAFFERRIVPAMAFAIFASTGSIAYSFYASQNAEKAIVASLDEGEIEALEEPEPEPEPEPEEPEEPEEEELEEIEEVEELPPEPQPRPVPVAPPDVLPQEIPDELPEASDKASEGPRVDDTRPTGTGTDGSKRVKKTTTDAAPQKKKVDLGDVDKPRNRVPEGGTPAKRISGAPPEYPKACRTRNIEGKYTLLLHVDKSGAVKGAKVIKKSNTGADPESEKRAHKLFLKAIQAAVKTWKYKPAKYGKQSFAVWKRVSIPFSLKGG